ncbi:MAG: glycosyltransferase [Candidatus Korarchaeota archaeon]|nr:glycosyltransferase [Candidatus Korarchaeota archaeon]NIU84401.1 glycosyltransferase [Candidatus Thorarchaeota archaeon]NIW14510.1 glycosyltransferase [Candidatus Thorarchaeota archaeon]NIW52589.1 glycosyltransferase [Candidatus Korarchaeota archaeon]
MLRPLIIASPNPSGSGGMRRSFEVLLRAKNHSIDPIIVVDYNFTPPNDGINLLKQRYDLYTIKPFPVSRGFKGPLYEVKILLSLLETLPLKKILEEADIIVSHHEESHFVLKSFLLHNLSNNLPWTTVLQSSLLRPSTVSQVSFLTNMRTMIQFKPLVATSLKVLQRTKSLVISPAIPTELNRYGYDLHHDVLDPPLAVDFKRINACEPSKKKFDAIYFTRLCPEKGVFDIPKFWSLVVREIPKAKLCIMGTFGRKLWKKKFFQKVKNLNLTANIIYKGFLNGMPKYAHIKSSKLLVYPSHCDAFSLVVLEALACGIPVVAYNIPAMCLNFPNKLVNTVPEYNLASLAEKTCELLTNDARRETLSKKAQKFTSTYTWDNVVEAEKQRYLDIIASWS